MKFCLYSFFKLGFKWGWVVRPRPGRPRTDCIRRPCGSQRRSGVVREISIPQGFNSRTSIPNLYSNKNNTSFKSTRRMVGVETRERRQRVVYQPNSLFTCLFILNIDCILVFVGDTECLAADLRLPSLAVRIRSCDRSTLFNSLTLCAISLSVFSQGTLPLLFCVLGA
jgi:hypothetical protein